MIRVLLVDDQAMVRTGFRTILESEDGIIVVGEAENGQVAIDRALDLAPDVICMDVQMPVMDGIDSARAIRAAEREAARPRTPIIALTANALSHQVEEYLAAGMDGHVAKPIEIAKLYEAISRALTEAAAAGAAASGAVAAA